MSVYSRCVEARGTTSMVSLPAASQSSYPVLRSRIGSGLPADGTRLLPLRKYGDTLNPYSDWIPSAGTTGVLSALLPAPGSAGELGPASLSSATMVSTRESVAWIFDTAKAPIEWP